MKFKFYFNTLPRYKLTGRSGRICYSITSGLLLVCIFSNIQLSSGQSDSSSIFSNKKNDLSFNATPLISSLFGVNNTPVDGQYSMVYRRSNTKRAFRLAAGYSTNIRKSGELNTGDFTSKTQFLRVKPGIERHFQIHHKMYLHLGFDAVLESSLSKSILDGRMLQKSRQVTFGAGPAVRFEYALNDALSVFTEIPIYLTRQWNQQSDIGNPTMDEFKTTSTENGFQFQAPLQLYFAFHF